MLLILVALGLGIFGVIQFGRTLEPRERIVLGVVFVLGVVCLGLWLVNAGLLGRTSTG